MKRLSLSCALLLLPLVASKKTWTLYHAWKGHDFTKRGSIALTLENSLPILSVENVASATHLPSEDLYQLKLVEDGKEDSYTLTSVPACQVHRANFRDEITLTLNNHASVVSMAYIPLVSPLAPSCSEVELKEESEFSSKIVLETGKVGMALPTVLPATKPPLGIKIIKGAKTSQKTNAFAEEQEPVTTPQGFLKRYWYVLLPLLIISMTGSGAPEEPPTRGPRGGESGQEGAAAAAAAAAVATPAAVVPVAATTPSLGGKQRRAKRA